MPAVTTLTFPQLINTSCQIGDTIYMVPTSTLGGFNINSSSATEVGIVSGITNTNGTQETFTVEFTGTIAAGDTWFFNGITTSSANTSLSTFASLVISGVYPNWTAASGGGNKVVFTHKQVNTSSAYVSATSISGATITGSFTTAITAAAPGTGPGSVLSIANGTQASIPANTFFFFSKDNKANLSTLLGYYAEVKLVNTTSDKIELFSVGMDIFESSK